MPNAKEIKQKQAMHLPGEEEIDNQDVMKASKGSTNQANVQTSQSDINQANVKTSQSDINQANVQTSQSDINQANVQTCSGEFCHRCQNPIGFDEIGITKKLINRGTTTYYCKSCLAHAFEITVADIDRHIAMYKRMGCTLFQYPKYDSQ